MLVRTIVPPAPFVTWEEAQIHLRLDGVEEKAYVGALISAACTWLDGPAGWLERSVGIQTLEVVSCAFGRDRLPYPPLVEIESITYRGTDNADHDLVEAQYRVMLDGSVAPLLGQSWPGLGDGAESVRVRYVAGYPDTVIPPEEEGGEEARTSTVPTPIKQAVLLLIGHWYANRETVVTGTISASLPFAVEALLSTFRIRGV